MKLVRYKQTKNRRRYESWVFRLDAEDRMKLKKVGSRYRVGDIDSNGTIFLEPTDPSSMTVSEEFLRKDGVRTSVRLHVSLREKDRFKQLCREHGTTMCRVLGDFIKAALVREDSLLEPGSVFIQSFYTGKPRGPSEKIYG